MEGLTAKQIARIERIKANKAYDKARAKEAQEKLLAGTMALLKKNTHERNVAEMKLYDTKQNLMNNNDKHIFALGRLSKYEDGIVEEALNFAKANGMCISCNSKIVDEKTIIKDYKNKSGKVFKAHYTIYNTYLGKCDDLGNEPIYYNGRFSYIQYQKTFAKYQRAYVDSFIKLEDLFNFNQTVDEDEDE